MLAADFVVGGVVGVGVAGGVVGIVVADGITLREVCFVLVGFQTGGKKGTLLSQ